MPFPSCYTIRKHLSDFDYRATSSALPTCLPATVPQAMLPTQPQAQAPLPKTTGASSKGMFSTNPIFSSGLPQSFSRWKINSTKKKLRNKSSCFGCSDSEMIIWGMRKEAAVLNLALSVEIWTPAAICRCLFAYLQQISLYTSAFLWSAQIEMFK